MVRFFGANALCHQLTPGCQIRRTALGIVSIAGDKVDTPLVQHPLCPV